MNEFELMNSVLKTIKTNDLISNGDKVVVGVSGGPDSICLLKALYLLKDELLIDIIAVHVNHMLRGEESELDEKFVVNFCEKLKTPLICKSVDIKGLSKKRGLSLEETAREARYSIFNEILKLEGAQKIAVAHNQNDLVETVLINMFRGSGLQGLTGIQYLQGKIIRPLLDIPRHRIETWLTKECIPYRVDSSNLEPIFTRNKIRLKMIPAINEILDIDIQHSLSRLAKLLKQDNDLLEHISKETYQKTACEEDKNTISMNITALKSMHYSIEGRLYRIGYANLTGTMKGLDNRHVEDIRIQIRNGQTGSEIHLPKGISAIIEYDKLILTSNRQRTPSFNYNFEVPGEKLIEQLDIVMENALIDIEQYNKEAIQINNKENGNTQYFDYSYFNSGICIRNRLNGDIIKPRHSPGTKKLKDFFIDAKIPRNKRDRIPLIADGKNIIWIVGIRTHEDYKVTENTRCVLKISFKRVK